MGHVNHNNDLSRDLTKEMQDFMRENLTDGIGKMKAILAVIRQNKND